MLENYSSNFPSYSCMKNMGSVLSRHNEKTLSAEEVWMQYGKKAECPFDNNCLIPRVINQLLS